MTFIEDELLVKSVRQKVRRKWALGDEHWEREMWEKCNM